MARRDTGTDDPRVRVRAGKGSRPRTKDRPDWSSKPLGRVIGIDRGRYQVSLEENGTRVVAVRARELGRGSVIMGDRVRLTGDLSGRPDTLARIVAVEERSSVLRRSLGTRRISAARRQSSRTRTPCASSWRWRIRRRARA